MTLAVQPTSADPSTTPRATGAPVTAVVDATHGLPVPPELTVDDAKRALFGADAWFRDGWEDLQRLAPPGRAIAVAQQHALVLLKPDAVAARLLHRSLDWFEDEGAAIVGSAAVQLDRQSFRAMWQWQLGASTRDRRDLGDAIVGVGPSLLVILRLPVASVPATVRVSASKGPADPTRRRPGQLRSALDGGNFLLNFVHAADEPADLARELSILLPAREREALIGGFADGGATAGAPSAARALATALQDSAEAHDLDFAATLRRLGARIEAVSGGRPAGVQARAAAQLAEIRHGRSRDWRGLLDAFRAAGIPLPVWDEIVVGTTLMDHSEPGVGQVLGSVSRQWGEVIA